jgi:hypothetical protein
MAQKVKGRTRIGVNLEKQEHARRVALAALRGNSMEDPDKVHRVGLFVRGWQYHIIKQLAAAEGMKVATFLTRDLLRIYPTLKRRPGSLGPPGGAAGGAAGGGSSRAGGGAS